MLPPGRYWVASSKSFAEIGFLLMNRCLAAATTTFTQSECLRCDFTGTTNSAAKERTGESALGILDVQKGFVCWESTEEVSEDFEVDENIYET